MNRKTRKNGRIPGMKDEWWKWNVHYMHLGLHCIINVVMAERQNRHFTRSTHTHATPFLQNK